MNISLAMAATRPTLCNHDPLLYTWKYGAHTKHMHTTNKPPQGICISSFVARITWPNGLEMGHQSSFQASKAEKG